VQGTGDVRETKVCAQHTHTISINLEYFCNLAIREFIFSLRRFEYSIASWIGVMVVELWRFEDGTTRNVWGGGVARHANWLTTRTDTVANSPRPLGSERRLPQYSTRIYYCRSNSLYSSKKGNINTTVTCSICQQIEQRMLIASRFKSKTFWIVPCHKKNTSPWSPHHQVQTHS
jgi:hypothetical protein